MNRLSLTDIIKQRNEMIEQQQNIINKTLLILDKQNFLTSYKSDCEMEKIKVIDDNVKNLTESAYVKMNMLPQTKKKVIRILCDKIGKDLGHLMTTYDPKTIDVLCYCKPGVPLHELVKDIDSVLSELNSDDVLVLISGNSNNNCDLQLYLSSAQTCNKCNKKNVTLFMSSLLYKNGNSQLIHNLNKLVYQVNCKLCNTLNAFSQCAYVELNTLTRNCYNYNRTLNNKGRLEIGKLLKHYNPTQSMSTLKFVSITYF